jgi:TonB family protein
MKSTVLCSLALAVFAISAEIQAAASDWLSAPRPKFPPGVLRKFSEGSVKLRLLIGKDGSVTTAAVLKGSGDPSLDEAARNAVSRWKMKPSAIKPSDLTKGRVEVIDFKQEAALAAVYPDRKASFDSWEHTEQWMYAPFPSYPLSERRLRHTGTVLLFGRILNDGRVSDVTALQSSGYPELDKCAVAAVRLWRAHKEYAGLKFKQPIRFRLGY